METLTNFLFEIDSSSNGLWLFQKTLILLILCGLIIYLLFFATSKIMYKKSDLKRDQTLRLSFLWSLVLFLFIFSIYCFFWIRFNGVESFNWFNWQFYIAISPQIIVYSCIILFFIYTLKKSKSRLKPLN